MVPPQTRLAVRLSSTDDQLGEQKKHPKINPTLELGSIGQFKTDVQNSKTTSGEAAELSIHNSFKNSKRKLVFGSKQTRCWWHLFSKPNTLKIIPLGTLMSIPIKYMVSISHIASKTWEGRLQADDTDREFVRLHESTANRRHKMSEKSSNSDQD